MPFSILLGISEYKLGKVENSYSFKEKNLIQQADSIETLILGSSQALKGLNPDLLGPNAYNLANISQTLEYDALLLAKYLNQMPHLHTVLVSISHFSYAEVLFDSDESWRQYFYYRFFRINTPHLGKTDIRKYSLTYLYGPWESIKILCSEQDKNLIAGYQKNGQMVMQNQSEKGLSKEFALHRVKLHEKAFEDYKHFEENITWLKKIIQVLQKRNIKVILVTPPVTKTYRLAVNRMYFDKNWETTASICNQFKIPYLNYFMDNQFDNSDFYDADHLNKKGADKWSEILNKDLKKL